MSELSQVFQEGIEKKQPVPGGPFLIQMLFREAPAAPSREQMARVFQQHCGQVECFCYDDKMAGFATLDHQVAFQEGKAPAQLMVIHSSPFSGDQLDGFLRGQMWDCLEDRDRILSECHFQVVATDLLTAGLPALERAELDMDFLEALAQLYPDCEAFYFQSCGKLVPSPAVREHQLQGPDRFIRFGVNARYFNVQNTQDMVVDTLGMGILFLPDLQYHFHGMDPNWVVNHAYNLAAYLLEQGCTIQLGETVDGVKEGMLSRQVQWRCQYEQALIRPPRQVLDVCMGELAAGLRQQPNRSTDEVSRGNTSV